MPVGKGRPRLGRNGHVYTPNATRQKEHQVASAWWSPVISLEIPIAVRVTAYYARPKDHFLKSGELSAKGKRSIVPMKTPDLDNVVKLVLDGLNGIAFKDDRQVQSVEGLRYWAGEQGPGVYVQVRELRPTEIVGSQQ
jgi:Holliday junction resolvase RusA-like endonuclease